MVENFNFQELTCTNEVAGYFDVGLAGGRVIGRVVDRLSQKGND